MFVVFSITDIKNLVSDVVYFDFSKAFDFLNHDSIFEKFIFHRQYIARVFSKNYLCKREHRLYYIFLCDDVTSSIYPLFYGFPEGSL